MKDFSPAVDCGRSDDPYREIESAMRFIEEMQVGINGVAMLSPLTGIGQYTFNLVRELQAMHLNPWLFYGTDWQQGIRAMALPGMNVVKNVFKSLIPHPYAVQRFLMQRLFSRGARQHRIQLYHEPNFMSYRFHGPSVVTVHDLSWIRYPETHPVERVREMNRLMPVTMQTAAHILTDSDFVRREVIEYYGLSEDRVTTAQLGVAAEFKPLNASQCASVMDAYRLQFGEYILVVATLEPRKNLGSVIAAFMQLPPAIRRRYPLVIAGMRGWGESLVSESVRQMISRGEARLTGFVPQSELPALYSGARLFVYPSLYEGFGLPPLEAMACGIPVIVSNRASLPEVVGNAGVLTEPLDDAGIAQHMRMLIEDDTLHRSLSEAGRQRAELFTWRRCAAETMAVYKKVSKTL
ncbi:MAG: glycosyltransferase family 4 protein [Burkholderiales bacterium]